MAEIVKNFTDNFSRYEQVLFQRGRVLIDGELNEIGRLERMQRHRGDTIEQFLDMPGQGSSRMATPTLKNIKILVGEQSGVDDNDVKIVPYTDGSLPLIQAFGYVWQMTEDETLTTDPNPGPGNSFQQIYFIITETEITAAAEAAIKIDDLGETARRVMINVEWKIGRLNIDEGDDEVPSPAPWDAGRRKFLVATIHRTEGQSQVRRGELIVEHRRPAENTRAVDRAMPGVVRLRSSTRNEGLTASAYLDESDGKLTISNLSVLVGLDRTSNNDFGSYTSVLVEGVFNLTAQDSLVLILPTDSNLLTSPQYIAVVGTPGYNELEMVVLDMTDIGIEQGAFSEVRSQNLDNMFVVVTNMSAKEDILAGTTADFVFADGKRLTRIRKGTGLLNESGRQEIRWSQGNMWHDWLPPGINDLIPTEKSDTEPWFRTYMPPRKNSIKEINSHVLRGVNEGAQPGSGDQIFYRTHTAYRAVVKFAGETQQFTGEIITINARWVPGNDLQSGGSWAADDQEAPSTIEYFGFDDGSAIPGGNAYKAWGFRANNAPGTWDVDEWDNSASEDGAHLKINKTGSMSVLQSQTSSLEGISNYRDISFSRKNLPVRNSGVSPTETSHHVHYAHTKPFAYGLIQCDGSGGVTLLDGAFNFDDLLFVDEGPGDSNNEAYIVMTQVNIANEADNSNYVITCNIVNKSGDDDSPTSVYHVFYPTIVSASTWHLKLYGNFDQFDNYSRPMAATKFHVSVVVHGGYNSNP